MLLSSTIDCLFFAEITHDGWRSRFRSCEYYIHHFPCLSTLGSDTIEYFFQARHRDPTHLLSKGELVWRKSGGICGTSWNRVEEGRSDTLRFHTLIQSSAIEYMRSLLFLSERNSMKTVEVDYNEKIRILMNFRPFFSRNDLIKCPSVCQHVWILGYLSKMTS